MCGIFGYTGKMEAEPILLNGLRLLQYRGYDSAGIAVLNGSVHITRTTGKVQCLADKLKKKNNSGKTGIAHTRWATHGKVNEENAHPHLSYSGRFVLVHNGIVENYIALSHFLVSKDYVFAGETDSEILVNYIDFLVIHKRFPVEEALRNIMAHLTGAFAFALMDKEDPDRIFAVRKMSPLIAGFSDGEMFLSSDLHALPDHVNRYFILPDLSMLILENGCDPILTDKGGKCIAIAYKALKHKVAASNTGAFTHHMLKEIYEQPDIMLKALQSGDEGLEKSLSLLSCNLHRFGRIIILASGTSFHAGIIGRYLIERYTKIPVSAEYASEFRYRFPLIGPDVMVIGISQSGETADTLAAMRFAREGGAFTLALCNVAESSITRESDVSILLGAGTEIGVASTKAFTAQIMKLIRLTSFMSSYFGQALPFEEINELLWSIPSAMRSLFGIEPRLIELTKKYSQYKNFLFLGRGVNYPVALEGALKLKEITYIHAEGYPACEMKHGPIALIDENFPTIAICCDEENRTRMISSIMEIKARNGKVIAVIAEGDQEIAGIVDDTIEIPLIHDALVPLLSVIPLQLFAYHMALALGCDVDHPRNLAKSVTVE